MVAVYVRDKVAYGARLKSRREAAGLSRMRLQGLSGVGSSSIKKLEDGSMKNLRLKTLFKLAKALKCSTSF